MKNYFGSLPGFVLLLGLSGPAVGQSLPPLPGEDVAPAATDVPVPLRPPEPTGPPSVAKPSASARPSDPRYTRYPEDRILHYDAAFKEIYPPAGKEKGEVSFRVSNPTSQPITISQIRPSCGCTLARNPRLPWTLNPGDSDFIHLEISLVGKYGVLTKDVKVYSTVGVKTLMFKAHLQPRRQLGSKMAMNERLRNIKIAAADRQAVFKGSCKSCHFDGAVGKKGEDLFIAACGNCHESPRRATMVPDLAVNRTETKRDLAYWLLWITHGKPGSLMPAFHQGQGGPLTNDQIQDLAAYMLKRFPDHNLPEFVSGEQLKEILSNQVNPAVQPK